MGVHEHEMLLRLARKRARKRLTRKRRAEGRRSGFFRDVPREEVESLWEKITGGRDYMTIGELRRAQAMGEAP